MLHIRQQKIDEILTYLSKLPLRNRTIMGGFLFVIRQSDISILLSVQQLRAPAYIHLS